MSRPSRASNNTCTTCRARKVRCDGNRHVCSNCDRLGLPCFYQQATGREADFTLHLPRQRAQRACRECRRRKMRCTGDAPSCDRCQHLRLECSYPDSRPSRAAQTASNGGNTPQVAMDMEQRDSPAGPVETSTATNPDSPDLSAAFNPTSHTGDPPLLPDEADMVQIFDNFFQHLYHVPVLSFLHKASLVQRYKSGLRDEALLHALVGVTSLLTDVDQEIKDSSPRHIDTAESLVLDQFERPSVLKIQTLVLIIEYRILSQQNEAAFMLISTVVRYSYALRLNYENPDMCFLAQESRRRLMWSVFLLDLHLASGLPDFTLCPAESIHVQLPCREESFELDLEQVTEPLYPPRERLLPSGIGLVALFIRLSWIRGKIIKSTKRIVLSRSRDVRQIMEEVCTLGNELQTFAAELPVEYQFSERNLQLRAHTPTMASYALLHIWWRQCHCDLYRIVLDGLHEALPSAMIHQLDQSFVTACQQQCLEKATEVVGTFKVILSIKTQLPFLDFHLPICAYQCARLLFYSYRTKIASFPMSAEKVTEQAQRCLDIVKACSSPWKGLLTIQRDLDTLIQRGCSRSPSPSPAPEDLSGGAKRRPSGPASSQQMFSRHSLIRRIGIVDDSDNLSMPPLSQAASTPSIAQSRPPRSTGFDADTAVVGDMQTVEAALVQDPLFAVVPSTPIRGSDAFDGALDSPLRVPGSFGLYPWDWPSEPWPARYDLPASSMGPDSFSGNMWTNWTT